MLYNDLEISKSVEFIDYMTISNDVYQKFVGSKGQDVKELDYIQKKYSRLSLRDAGDIYQQVSKWYRNESDYIKDISRIEIKKSMKINVTQDEFMVLVKSNIRPLQVQVEIENINIQKINKAEQYATIVVTSGHGRASKTSIQIDHQGRAITINVDLDRDEYSFERDIESQLRKFGADTAQAYYEDLFSTKLRRMDRIYDEIREWAYGL